MRIRLPRIGHDLSRRLTAAGSLVGAVVILGIAAAPAAGLNVINESQSVIPSQCVGSACSITDDPERTLVLRNADTPAIRFDQIEHSFQPYVANMDQHLSSVDRRIKAIEGSAPPASDLPVTDNSALRQRINKQAKRIKALTRRQRATTRHLRKLSRQVRSLGQSRR